MIPMDTTAPSQPESISFEFDLRHPPEKVWRALTDLALHAEWLLPVIDLELERGQRSRSGRSRTPGGTAS